MDDDAPATGDDHAEPMLPLATSHEPQTVLPPPLATAVSLFTATSSVSLRFGSWVGNLAFNVGKITTLTGFELTRAILEGILSRAGQDVVQTSRGQLGRRTAEGLLERALTALHQLVTTSSFLVSAGFQIGSTGMNAGLAMGQSLLSALDALFGDTETSKAIATIIVLVQREVSGDGTVKDGESVSLSDIFTSVLAFALLQRWGYRRTQLENEQTGAMETIWDIVVLADLNAPITPQTAVDAEKLGPACNADVVRARPQSSASFMSALGDAADIEVASLDDSRSFVSVPSTRAHHDLFTDGQLDPSLRDHIAPQLKPGTDVRITVRSMTTNSITVEINGDHDEAILDAPSGYALASSAIIEPNSRRVVYQNQAKKRKVGQFEVQGSKLLRRLWQHVDSIPPSFPEIDRGPSMTTSLPLPVTTSISMPVEANQKRSRVTNVLDTNEIRLPIRPPSDTTPPVQLSVARHEVNPFKSERLSKVKDTLKHRTSYKNLFDFWNNSQPKWPVESKALPRTMPHPSSRPVSPSNFRGRAQNFAPGLPPLSRQASEVNSFASPTAENLAALDTHDLPVPRLERNHKKEASIYSVMSATSETSVVLHARPEDASCDITITALHCTGHLPGQYPPAPFASNVARFLRFATASYGQSFLRILGTGATVQQRPNSPRSSDPKEHRSFSSYTRLPASTVLLSSYVDPHGVPVVKEQLKGQNGAATVLVHYVSLDHKAKAVVLTCRGSLGVEDILTDLTADYDDFFWQNEIHQVHQGILAAARKLLSSYNGRLMATLATALEEFPDYGLVLCGHSLGGGVASVLAMLLAEPNPCHRGNEFAFVTKAPGERSRSIDHTGKKATTSTESAFSLPAGRPVHVYAYGPAASVSPSLQKATRRLITSIIHGQDAMSYLSLGSLRDFRSIALAFKTDQGHVKNEIRHRLWEGLQNSFRDRGGLNDRWLPPDALSEDPWPWLALQGLRSNLNATKLLPPGDVFHIDSKPVLQRHFPSESTRLPEESRTFKPAKHVTVAYVRDVESHFREIAFGPSMWFDHLPMRYEAVLETLEKGLLA